MENETVRERVLRLLQKSRQAFRLYDSMGRYSPAIRTVQNNNDSSRSSHDCSRSPRDCSRSPRDCSAIRPNTDRRSQDSSGPSSADLPQFTEMQAAEWRSVNAEIIKELSLALDNPNPRQLSSQLFMLRGRFWDDFRQAETDVHRKQKELMLVAEKGDFVRSASLSQNLIALKARMQATQAAHHELDVLINRSRLNPPTSHSSELTDGAKATPESSTPMMAKVIPLRKV